MPVFRYLFLLFLLVPLVEIYFLIQVGKVIGAGWTVFFVVFTAVLGAALLRMQGLATLNRVQQSLEQGRLPAIELVEGLMLLVAGALLLTPGFVTDTIGFVLLVPPLRRQAARWLIRKGLIGNGFPPGPSAGAGGAGSGPRTIEGEVVGREEKKSPPGANR